MSKRPKYGVSLIQTQPAAIGSNNNSSLALAAIIKKTYPSLAKKTDKYQKIYQSLVQWIHQERN